MQMQRIFMNNLTGILSSNVRGTVKVHIFDDVLTVDIISSRKEMYHYVKGNITQYLIHSMSAKDLSKMILNDYVEYVLRKYFK